MPAMSTDRLLFLAAIACALVALLLLAATGIDVAHARSSWSAIVLLAKAWG